MKELLTYRVTDKGLPPDEQSRIIKNFHQKNIGKVITVNLSNEKKRTLEQNNALWRWDNELSQETGYTPKEIHYLMLGLIYGTKRINNLDMPIKTSSELSTIEFSQYVEIYPAVALEHFGITLSPFSYAKDNL
jgi:hypothetical protein